MSNIKRKKRMAKLLRHVPKPIRHRILRSMVHIPDLPDGLSFEVARTREDLDAAFSLLYDAYVKKGITEPNPSERRLTKYHALPSTVTLVVKFNSTVIATVSIIRDSFFGLPADALVDLSQFRGSGKRMAEISSLAIRNDLHGKSAAIMFYLTKYLLTYSRDYFGIDRFIIVVHPDRMDIYEGLFMCRPLHKKAISEYSFVNNAPALNASLNLDTVEEKCRIAYKGKPDNKNIHSFYFRPLNTLEKVAMEFPQRRFPSISDPVMTPPLMDYFFNTCTQLFNTMTDEQIHHLREIYPHPEYHQILPVVKAPKQFTERLFARYETQCSGLMRQKNRSVPAFIDILNISRKGMRIHSKVPIRQESNYSFQVVIANQAVARVEGRFSWSRDGMYGIELTKTDLHWKRFVDHQQHLFAHAVTDESMDMVAAS